MSTPVVMPQMGESIAEGTIVRWIKKVGDAVDRDEPLFEISTDKVDAEIPAPAAGVLIAIAVKEGETVPVNSVVGTIGTAGEAPAEGASGASGAKGAESATSANGAKGAKSAGATKTSESADATGTPGGSVAAPASPPTTNPAPQSASARGDSGERRRDLAVAASGRDGGAESAFDRQKSSPLVRRIAKEHNVDIGRIAGSGIGGRVTKQDILGYLDSDTSSTPAAVRESFDSGSTRSASKSLAQDDIVPMSVMRKKIADHMVVSRRTSAHVYSVFEVNYSRIDQIRQARKDEFERNGAKLTFTSLIAKVVVDALRVHGIVNASIDGDNIVYKKDINLGIAVALDNGLIVPVVKAAGEKNLLGLSKAIQDVADRARAKKLNPEEVHGGTFTITNPGNFGAQFGMPIINQPQVAILGVGTIEKRPVVVDDAIGIRLMGYLTLGYDHRLIDGAVADQFMADVKKGIENFDPARV
ncbi:MAG: dihydrolipoamide acetyltransferase family protein [Acidobacteriota bacterium]|nr:dihydrolipoamide acetyltransferase family protein [Acidobacteriota bacterium]